jgi:hypothetical protein
MAIVYTNIFEQFYESSKSFVLVVTWLWFTFRFIFSCLIKRLKDWDIKSYNTARCAWGWNLVTAETEISTADSRPSASATSLERSRDRKQFQRSTSLDMDNEAKHVPIYKVCRPSCIDCGAYSPCRHWGAWMWKTSELRIWIITRSCYELVSCMCWFFMTLSWNCERCAASCINRTSHIVWCWTVCQSAEHQHELSINFWHQFEIWIFQDEMKY